MSPPKKKVVLPSGKTVFVSGTLMDNEEDEDVEYEFGQREKGQHQKTNEDED